MHMTAGTRRGGWPGPRKPNTNVRLDPALTRRLRQHAEATGRSVTGVVEAAVAEHLDRTEREPNMPARQGD